MARVRKQNTGEEVLKALRREERERAKILDNLPKKKRISAAVQSPVRPTDPATVEAKRQSKAGNSQNLLPYDPTATTDPSRPRTLAAGYDSNNKILRVRFRDGTPWEYFGVPEDVWDGFQKTSSPGRYIASVLDNYTYSKGDF